MKHLYFLAFLLIGTASYGAEVAGIAMPDVQDTAGAHLVLNGLAVRTYSFLGVRIYVAGLYMPSRTSDPNTIMSSTQPRLLRFVFMRDVEADAARKSWRESLDASCRPPCSLPPDGVARFIAGVPAVRKGDVSEFLFTGHSLSITLNGQSLGTINDPAFSRVILSTFIGDHPTAMDVKKGLLGLRS